MNGPQTLNHLTYSMDITFKFTEVIGLFCKVLHVLLKQKIYKYRVI